MPTGNLSMKLVMDLGQASVIDVNIDIICTKIYTNAYSASQKGLWSSTASSGIWNPDINSTNDLCMLMLVPTVAVTAVHYA